MTTTRAPADTTIMRIVHDALRRDLVRVRKAFEDPARVRPAQGRAIGEHLTWMMGFLRAHHASEDDGLYPLLRERALDSPEVLAVIDRMGREHDEIGSAIDGVEAAAAALVHEASVPAVERVLTTVDDLESVLLPHLREEEDEAMPAVSRLISADEWQAIEQEHNLDPKSMSELGFEGHWLIDDTTDDDRALVVGLVPPVQRFVLLHGFARRYRRRAAACWDPAPPRRVQEHGSVTVTVDSGIDAIWEVVRDVTRVGEWSHECVGARWVGEPAAPVPGARFRGENRAGPFRWGRLCEITSADAYDLVWVTVPTRLFPDSTQWRISLDDADGATTITQSFQVVRAPKAYLCCMRC